jgi:MFS family permease
VSSGSAQKPAGTRLSRTVSKTFLSLRNRNFRLYFIGQLISNTGNWLTNVALILLVLKITGSGLAVGVLVACQFGPVLLLSAWAGAVADRSDKRKLLLVTQSLEMAQSIGLAILAFLAHPPLVRLYALAIGGGTLLAFDNPLRRSFVTEMVRAEDIPNAVVLYSIIVNVARIFGPALAGLLVVTLGFGWCFTLDATSYLAVLLCLVMMRSAELHRRLPKPRTKGEVREGLGYVMSMPSLWISFGMLVAIQMLAYNFMVTLPLFVTDTLHSTGGVFTILYSVFGFGAVVSALVVAHRGLVRIRHIILGAVALGLTMLLLASAPGVGFAVPAVLLVGMACILYLTATTAIAQVEAKPEMHGRVLALQTVIIGGATLIGGPVLGLIADNLGGRAPIILGGIVCLIAATFGYLANRHHVHRTPARGGAFDQTRDYRSISSECASVDWTGGGRHTTADLQQPPHPLRGTTVAVTDPGQGHGLAQEVGRRMGLGSQVPRSVNPWRPKGISEEQRESGSTPLDA